MEELASIDHDRLSGNVRAISGHQECNHARYVFWGFNTTQRDLSHLACQ